MASEDEDDSEDEEIMVDAAVRLSLQAVTQNNASTSSSRTHGPSAAAMLRAATAEKRIARNQRALTRAITAAHADDESEKGENAWASESESARSSSGSESDEEPLAKKTQRKVTVEKSGTEFPSLKKVRLDNRNKSLEIRRELKKEERALMVKLGRRLTYVGPISFFPHNRFDPLFSRLRRRQSLFTDFTLSSRLSGVMLRLISPLLHPSGRSNPRI